MRSCGGCVRRRRWSRGVGKIGKAEYGERVDTCLLLSLGSSGTGPLSCGVQRSLSFFDVAFFLNRLATIVLS
jgi:hypothetical protein